jgi:predicted glycoside hydrolase/deacetylase ChbG (UPF0249 family)
MKKLIINADDLGADDFRNAGIFETIEAGVVTSVSFLANGPAREHALCRKSLFLGKRVSVGIHLNLSEGTPLTTDLHIITGQNGYFMGKNQAHRLFAQKRDSLLEEEIYRETVAQIEVLHKADISITHIDGHQHIHIFPAVIEPVVMAAEAFGIPWIRVPHEPFEKYGHDAFYDSEARVYCEYAAKARSQIINSGLRTTDHFRGLYLKGRVSLPLLKHALHHLPDGLTELMVHPGRVPTGVPHGPFALFSTFDRETECMALLHREFYDILAHQGISLVPFPEIRL